MPSESASIGAIKLARTVFEYIHGNLGVLKFNVDELTPINGDSGEESKRWKVICSFFETLGSSAPSKYEALVNLNDNTVTIKKLSEVETKEQKYTVVPKEEPTKEEPPKEEPPK